jgi:hypothetical protein
VLLTAHNERLVAALADPVIFLNENPICAPGQTASVQWTPAGHDAGELHSDVARPARTKVPAQAAVCPVQQSRWK